jgi:hypothetical protein
MQENRERWMKLAEQASCEQDPQKLLALIREINQLLAEKQDRLNQLAATQNHPPNTHTGRSGLRLLRNPAGPDQRLAGRFAIIPLYAS